MQELYAYRDGNLIGVYKSSQEASKALNLSDSTISTIKNQKKKTRKGLRFSNEPLDEEILAEDRKTNTLDKQTAKLHEYYLKGLFTRIYNRIK